VHRRDTVGITTTNENVVGHTPFLVKRTPKSNLEPRGECTSTSDDRCWSRSRSNQGPVQVCTSLLPFQCCIHTPRNRASLLSQMPHPTSRCALLTSFAEAQLHIPFLHVCIRHMTEPVPSHGHLRASLVLTILGASTLRVRDAPLPPILL
jgi:hypothetical protein